MSDSLNAPGWTPITDKKDFSPTGVKYMWLREPLPEWDGKNPGIYSTGISQEVQVYIDQTLAYQFGNFFHR